MAHVTGVASLARLDEIDRRSIDAIVRALTPEAIPIQCQHYVPAPGQVQLRMNVNVVCRTDQRRFTKICTTRKERVECLKISVVRIVIAARDVRLQAEPWLERGVFKGETNI